MSTQTYEYRFDTAIPVQELEDTFMLSLIAVESVFGHSRVRMDARFEFDRKNRRCRIDCSNEVGLQLARIFTGYATREYGEGAVQIDISDAAVFRTANARDLEEVHQ